MPEVSYVPNPKNTTLSFSSRAFDCNCLGSASGLYVLKTGDSMTGKLGINVGTKAIGPGEALKLEAVYDDGGFVSQDFSLLTLKLDDTSGNFLSANALTVRDSTNSLTLAAGNFGLTTSGSISTSILAAYTNPFAQTGLRFIVTATQCGFFGVAVVQQVSGANLTNNVTVGGTNDTIADFTSLTVYATDAATIRNDIHQLARKLKQINDGLRAYGLFT